MKSKEKFLETLRTYVNVGYLEILTEDDLFKEVTGAEDEEDLEDEYSGAEDEEKIIKRKILWLASTYDRLNEILTNKIKDNPKYLKLLYLFNNTRRLFRFFLSNYKLFNNEERKEIVQILEEFAKRLIEKLK